MREPLDEVYIDELLQEALSKGWSELYLEQGKPPYGRVGGSYQMDELSQYEVVRKVVLQRMAYDMLSNEQIARLEEHGVLQFYHVAVRIARFSVRLVVVDGRMEASFQVLPKP